MRTHDCRESEDDFGQNPQPVRAGKLTQEQAPPRPSDGDMWLLVLKDMEERRQHGIEKYGVPVQPFNGRDPLIDAYQEALDLCVYLRQAIEEIKHLRDEVARLKEGRFTPEELQGLCHNLAADNRATFEEGCRKYQDELFGPKGT